MVLGLVKIQDIGKNEKESSTMFEKLAAKVVALSMCLMLFCPCVLVKTNEASIEGTDIQKPV